MNRRSFLNMFKAAPLLPILPLAAGTRAAERPSENASTEVEKPEVNIKVDGQGFTRDHLRELIRLVNEEVHHHRPLIIR